MQRIRTAIIGYGRSGSQMHAGAVEANDPFHLVAVCDLDPARRLQASDRFHCALYEDYHQMLARERLDLVIIVTRSDQHCQMTCDCLAAGVNVLVTKPWAVDAAEGHRMMEAEAKSGRRLFPWLPARWGCELTRLRQLLAERAIGQVFAIRRAVCSFGTRCDWQTERRYGGGYLLNWGAHIIDPPLLLKASPVRTVYGRMKQVINPGDVEDLFFAHLLLADGTLVQAEYTVATIELPNWFLQGDLGTIEIRGRQLTVSRKTPDRPDDPTRFATMKADGQQVTTETLEGATWGDEKEIYAELARELRNDGRYPIASADALALSRVFDAIRTSSAENRLVTL